MVDRIPKGKQPQSAQRSEDGFVHGTFRLASWSRNNLRTVLFAIGGIGIFAVGTLYYVNFRASVHELAAADLASLRLAPTDPETMISDLEAYVQRFAGSESADEARLILSRMYLDTDRAPEAARVANEVEAPHDKPVGFAARTLLAAAQEANEDPDAALATFEDLAQGARFPFQQRQARASAARILVTLERLEEAAAIYSTIADEAEKAEDLTEAGVYRLRLGELKGQLRQRRADS
jgi:predicted negative regulator of RcsB-dependent stress response